MNMIQQPTLHLSVSSLELLRDLLVPVVQSQAVEEHDIFYHTVSTAVPRWSE